MKEFKILILLFLSLALCQTMLILDLGSLAIDTEIYAMLVIILVVVVRADLKIFLGSLRALVLPSLANLCVSVLL